MSKKDIKTNLAKLEKSKFYKYEITSYSDINNINFAVIVKMHKGKCC